MVREGVGGGGRIRKEDEVTRTGKQRVGGASKKLDEERERERERSEIKARDEKREDVARKYRTKVVPPRLPSGNGVEQRGCLPKGENYPKARDCMLRKHAGRSIRRKRRSARTIQHERGKRNKERKRGRGRWRRAISPGQKFKEPSSTFVVDPSRRFLDCVMPIESPRLSRLYEIILYTGY